MNIVLYSNYTSVKLGGEKQNKQKLKRLHSDTGHDKRKQFPDSNNISLVKNILKQFGEKIK